MAKKNNKKKSATVQTNPAYSYLLINKTLRNLLFILVALATIGLGAMIYVEINKGTHWFVIAMLSTLGGLILIAFPQTEYWIYKPWQKAPQRMERIDGR